MLFKRSVLFILSVFYSGFKSKPVFIFIEGMVTVDASLYLLSLRSIRYRRARVLFYSEADKDHLWKAGDSWDDLPEL